MTLRKMRSTQEAMKQTFCRWGKMGHADKRRANLLNLEVNMMKVQIVFVLCVGKESDQHIPNYLTMQTGILRIKCVNRDILNSHRNTKFTDLAENIRLKVNLLTKWTFGSKGREINMTGSTGNFVWLAICLFGIFEKLLLLIFLSRIVISL